MSRPKKSFQLFYYENGAYRFCHVGLKLAVVSKMKFSPARENADMSPNNDKTAVCGFHSICAGVRLSNRPRMGYFDLETWTIHPPPPNPAPSILAPDPSRSCFSGGEG